MQAACWNAGADFVSADDGDAPPDDEDSDADPSANPDTDADTALDDGPDDEPGTLFFSATVADAVGDMFLVTASVDEIWVAGFCQIVSSNPETIDGVLTVSTDPNDPCSLTGANYVFSGGVWEITAATAKPGEQKAAQCVRFQVTIDGNTSTQVPTLASTCSFQ